MLRFRNICRNTALILSAAAFAACADSARISAEIQDAPDSEIVIRQQNVNRYDVLDTLTTDTAGRFSCKVRLPKGDPDFIYVYRNGKKLASLLLSRGDKVQVVADTSGHFSVSGSDEAAKLASVEEEYSGFLSEMDSLASAMENGKDADQPRLRQEMAKCYTDYYRKCVRYVMENPRSLTVVPVLYQTVSDGFYVFSQDTDALHFRNAADSLATVYPDSRYVRALRQEAGARSRQLELRVRMQTAEQVGYLDMELPDVNGKQVRLGEVAKDARAVLLCFWSPDDALQKMFNLDVLKKAYETYKDKGLEIYQVAIAVDKPSWERVVSAQGLGWTNVCDGLGWNSPAARMYNVSRLPAYFLIEDGQLSDKTITDEKSLFRALREVL